MEKLTIEKLSIHKKVFDALATLESDKFHILFFSYSFNFSNIRQSLLLIISKIFNFFTGDRISIDHVTNIMSVNKKHTYVLEASLDYGTRLSHLYDRLLTFKGTCYVVSLDLPFKKTVLTAIENTHLGVPYNKEDAMFAGLDIKLIDRLLKPKAHKNSEFCSKLVVVILNKLFPTVDTFKNLDANEITPKDLYSLLDICTFATKRVLYKY